MFRCRDKLVLILDLLQAQTMLQSKMGR